MPQATREQIAKTDEPPKQTKIDMAPPEEAFGQKTPPVNETQTTRLTEEQERNNC